MFEFLKREKQTLPAVVAKEAVGPVTVSPELQALAPTGLFAGIGGFWSTIREAFAGAWQCNIEWKRETVLANNAVFSCVTLIASDICKLAINRLGKDSDDIWKVVAPGEASVLQAPNNYQNRIQFVEQWITSKLTRGNTYVLKGRDKNGKVVRLHVLCPDLVLPLVTTSGDVYYQLGVDNLTGISEQGVTVPASEIIHDRFNCLFHPLVGLSPIWASGLAAYQGLKIQENSARFFKNMSRPSGILTAPGAISPETAATLKLQWETNYSGDNVGKVAVLGDDLKYESIATNADDAQLIEQLKMTAEIVCSTFHVPAYKVLGTAPAFNNIEALQQQYYDQCLQRPIEDLELCLNEGLEVKGDYWIEVELDGLLRMDTKTQVDTLAVGVKSGLYTPNEARKKLNLKPLRGGDTVYLQQQQFSIEALAKRDAQDDPFGTAKAAVAPATNEDDPAADPTIADDDLPPANDAAKFLTHFAAELGIKRLEAPHA